MKILIIITLSELGGAQSVAAMLANELSKRHDVALAAGEGDGKMWETLVPEVRKIQLRHLQRAINPKEEIKALIELRKLKKDFKPDVVHLHSSKAGILGRLVFNKSKIVYTVHGFDSIRLAYRKFLPLEKILQKRCSAIVGVSEYDRIHLLEEGINNNVGLVYNGIPLPKSIEKGPFTFAEKYKKKILCIARLSPQKNHSLFIEIAKLLPEYAFIWIGNQKEPEEKYPSNVFFIGNLPNAGGYCKYADLFLLPSNYEGLPIVIIEAMSQGIPVVASNVGGVSEIVIDGQTGYALENNAEVMAEKIDDILKDSAFYHNLSMNAKMFYENNLTIEKMASGYEKIFTDIFEKNKRNNDNRQ